MGLVITRSRREHDPLTGGDECAARGHERITDGLERGGAFFLPSVREPYEPRAVDEKEPCAGRAASAIANAELGKNSLEIDRPHVRRRREPFRLVVRPEDQDSLCR